MKWADCTTIPALLSAVDKVVAEYRREHGPGSFIDLSHCDISPEGVTWRGPSEEDWQARYRDIYERALDLLRPGMTDLPLQENDVYSGLLGLKQWCRKNMPAEDSAEKPNGPGQPDGAIAAAKPTAGGSQEEPTKETGQTPAGTTARPDSQPSPLSEREGQVYEILSELPIHKAMKVGEILDALNDRFGCIMGEDTLRKNILNALKPHGLQHRKGVGYYIRK